MKTIFEYTQNNILVIPQALFAMKDVTKLIHYGTSVIFYKHLEQDLVDVEFYTNNPCLIYIESGCEVLTDRNNDIIELNSGAAIFLPQGSSLHSDYVKKTDSLKAYLVFFDEQVITNYLSMIKIVSERNRCSHGFCLIDDTCRDFLVYFDSIQHDIKDPSYLHLKLQELLHLIAWKSDKRIFQQMLLSTDILSPRRNLRRLLERHDIVHLTVSDLAQLSGRSLSSFNRDFKAIYKIPPQKWLREKKLSHAKELLTRKGLSVTQAASEVGYENVSNFIKAFKLKYGQTPKQIKMSK